MADAREQLSREGLAESDADAVIRRALELQQRAHGGGQPLDSTSLEAGAEAVGVPREFIQQAIEELKAERQREEVARAARKRTLRIAGIAVAVFLAVTLLYGQRTLNSQMTVVHAKQAQLENVLQRRHDLIPNLIAITKASAAHEEKLASSLGSLAQRAGNAPTFAERQAAEQQLDAAVDQTLAALRSDPNTASSTMFIRLSDEMAGAENRIAVERKRYDEAAADYNRTAGSFPVSLVRPLLGYPRNVPLFKAARGAEETPRF